jgi:hypothetical protein
MVGTNLGIGSPVAWSSVPLYENYLQPMLFVGLFLPFILRGWHQADRRLQAVYVALAPLLVASNLCFGWLYESRNYLPLVPVQATLAVAGFVPKRRPEEGEQGAAGGRE